MGAGVYGKQKIEEDGTELASLKGFTYIPDAARSNIKANGKYQPLPI